MKFLKTLTLTALTAAALASPAAADLSDTWGQATSPKKVGGPAPSAAYQGQHWISPEGCTYSRAKAPGYAPTWHLVHNGSQYGMTDAKRGCSVMRRSR